MDELEEVGRQRAHIREELLAQCLRWEGMGGDVGTLARAAELRKLVDRICPEPAAPAASPDPRDWPGGVPEDPRAYLAAHPLTEGEVAHAEDSFFERADDRVHQWLLSTGIEAALAKAGQRQQDAGGGDREDCRRRVEELVQELRYTVQVLGRLESPGDVLDAEALLERLPGCFEPGPERRKPDGAAEPGAEP